MQQREKWEEEEENDLVALGLLCIAVYKTFSLGCLTPPELQHGDESVFSLVTAKADVYIRFLE
jgi:hypothetical protein